MLDDGEHEGVLAGEVLVELALARAGALEDLVEAGAVDPLLGEERGRGRDDPLPGGCSSRRDVGHPAILVDWTDRSNMV